MLQAEIGEGWQGENDIYDDDLLESTLNPASSLQAPPTHKPLLRYIRRPGHAAGGWSLVLDCVGERTCSCPAKLQEQREFSMRVYSTHSVVESPVLVLAK